MCSTSSMSGLRDSVLPPQDGYLSSLQVALAKEQLYVLLRLLRREAVPLVDAFDYPDEMLNSALGRYDGDVYTHLYNWAQQDPRNKKQVCRSSIYSGTSLKAPLN